MAPLLTFKLPLPQSAPPTGYDCSDRALSVSSTTTAFNTGLGERDQFLGIPRCIVCGISFPVDRCRIISDSGHQNWNDLKERCWIPHQAKDAPHHDPRNGMIMCKNHSGQFNAYRFFIRFFPDIRKFVLINYSGREELQPFHGKAVALDIKDRHVPFPSLFIIHEMRVRGFHPFQPVSPAVPDDILWQGWILSREVFDDASGSFKRDGPPRSDKHRCVDSETQLKPVHPSTTTAPSGQRALALNEDVIADILAATRSSPSWKACVLEGTNWTGTAKENIEKYTSSIGAQDD